mmetsp:Transcript_41577/g.96819  ORF Transcript_41577/g.96819 Transcript_41577/m.96819 type:complete len:123 (-) Transcript_41577:1668-2036(-)
MGRHQEKMQGAQTAVMHQATALIRSNFRHKQQSQWASAKNCLPPGSLYWTYWKPTAKKTQEAPFVHLGQLVHRVPLVLAAPTRKALSRSVQCLTVKIPSHREKCSGPEQRRLCPARVASRQL